MAVIAATSGAAELDPEDALSQRLGATAYPDDLGKLDGLVSSPARLSKVRMTDSKKIAAILLESNIVELQRHLLTITVQNQVSVQGIGGGTT